MKNLYIVASPLQTINAMEAMRHFDTKNNIIVAIYNDVQKNTDQVEDLLSRVEAEDIIRIYPSKTSKFPEYVKLINRLKKHTYNYVFSGDFGTTYRVIIANLRKNKTFLLDDGTLTITLYGKYLKPNKLNEYNFRVFRYLLVGLKISIKEKINLFTYFDFEPLNGVDIIKNELKHLSSYYDIDKDKADEKTLYLLGQTALGLFENLDDYVNDVKKVLDTHSDKKVIYIPHRSEGETVTNKVRELTNPNLEILTIDKSVELYFLENSIYPLYVVSHISTALLTLKLIFKECKSYNIPTPYSSNPRYKYEKAKEISELLYSMGVKKF